MATRSEANDGSSNIPSSSAGATASGDQNEEHNANFECNICLDTAKDAVISLCGHLFCWPCLHRWLETRPNKSVCPVCKAGISKEKVIPLFGRGSNSNQDPREKMPPRPQARRTEPENNGSFHGLGGDGFQLSFGIGAFPFAFFSSTFAGGNQQANPPGSPQQQDEQFLSKLFLWVAFLFMFWLLIA